MPDPTRAVQMAHEWEQQIIAPPSEVFPLLCPEREKEWLPGWQARMIHSRSGVAEPGAIFATPHPAGEATWLVVDHRPCSHVRFVRFEPDGMLVDISIDLDGNAAGGSTVRIRYLFTATAATGVPAVQARTDAAWREMMIEWQDRMNAYLRAHATR